MNLFIVGRVDEEDKRKRPSWEFVGVFDDEDKAVDACLSEYYFVGPIKLNENVETNQAWSGGYWPLFIPRDDPGVDVRDT